MFYWILTIILLVVASAALWAVFSAVFGRGETLPPADRGPLDQRVGLTPRTINSQSISQVRFALSRRGYNPVEVDEALEQIAAYTRALEEENAQLRAIQRPVED